LDKSAAQYLIYACGIYRKYNLYADTLSGQNCHDIKSIETVTTTTEEIAYTRRKFLDPQLATIWTTARAHFRKAESELAK
jgi:hypothetical protein